MFASLGYRLVTFRLASPSCFGFSFLRNTCGTLNHPLQYFILPPTFSSHAPSKLKFTTQKMSRMLAFSPSNSSLRLASSPILSALRWSTKSSRYCSAIARSPEVRDTWASWRLAAIPGGDEMGAGEDSSTHDSKNADEAIEVDERVVCESGSVRSDDKTELAHYENEDSSSLMSYSPSLP
jgi:hypothetical protein